MTVTNRIKILDIKDCKNVQEIENRINDFLQEKEVKRFMSVNYMLDVGAVILEYMTCGNNSDDLDPGMIANSYPYYYYSELYKIWLQTFLFPFYPYPPYSSSLYI